MSAQDKNENVEVIINLEEDMYQMYNLIRDRVFPERTLEELILLSICRGFIVDRCIAPDYALEPDIENIAYQGILELCFEVQCTGRRVEV